MKPWRLVNIEFSNLLDMKYCDPGNPGVYIGKFQQATKMSKTKRS